MVLILKVLLVGNSSMDTYDGGTTASWVWACCQSFIGGLQDAFKGISMLIHIIAIYFPFSDN